SFFSPAGSARVWIRSPRRGMMPPGPPTRRCSFMTHAAPLELWQETIRPDWIDHNGHMNVAYYTLVFDHGVDAFFEYVGLGTAYREGTTGSTFAVEQHIIYNR